VKQLVVLSGKGGTGKTSLVAAFAHLAAQPPPDSNQSAPARLVLVDADVDAANLELVLQPTPLEEHEFTGGHLAVVDAALCDGCGACEEVCRFDAIRVSLRHGFPRAAVEALACEGCAACTYACPRQAIQMVPQVVGKWFRSATPFGPLFHAALQPGAENSGKLVTLVKQMARLLALDEAYPLVLVDGPPGIGCPVISAVAGADMALMVAEPSVAGIHDLERIWGVIDHFGIVSAAVINKGDIYPEGSRRIESFCRERDVPLLGVIPFDLAVTQAMAVGQPVTAFGGPSAEAMAAVWRQVVRYLGDLT
jgi:MinD superfamily P-loop ATPase